MSPVDPSKIKICPYCSKAMLADAVLCKLCGFDLEKRILTNMPQSDKIRLREASVVEGSKQSGGCAQTLFKVLLIAVILGVAGYFLMQNVNNGSFDNLLTSFGLKRTKSVKSALRNPKRPAGQGPQDAGAQSFVPFLTPGEKTNKQESLEGIFFDPSGKSFVTINGEILYAGSSYKQIKIEKINDGSVEVSINQERKVLKVGDSIK